MWMREKEALRVSPPSLPGRMGWVVVVGAERGREIGGKGWFRAEVGDGGADAEFCVGQRSQRCFETPPHREIRGGLGVGVSSKLSNGYGNQGEG